MAEVERVKISEFFKLFPPTHLLGTTYTLSLAFFESAIFPIIDRSALSKCVVVADELGLSRAIQEAPALRGAGKDYVVTSAPCKGSFHPKVWVMYNDTHFALLVGSGNLTQSGIMDNVEMFDCINGKFEDSDVSGAASDTIQFLTNIEGLWPSIMSTALFPVEVIRNIKKDLAPRIREPKVARSFTFISSGHKKIIDQLPESDDELLDFYVGSPFFGGSTDGLKLLTDRYKPKKTHLFAGKHSGDTVDFDPKDLAKIKNLVTKEWSFAKKGFHHLKMFSAVGEKKAWLFCGSANCTVAALNGDNFEAGILRTVSPQDAKSYFTGKLIDIEDFGIREDRRASQSVKTVKLWGSYAGDTIQLVISDEWQKRLPLKNVSVSVRIGPHRSKVLIIDISKLVINIRWQDLFDEYIKKANAVVLTISGLDNSSAKFEGSCFVDDKISLSTTPSERRALRGAFALLSGEELPDYDDLSALTTMLVNFFDESEVDNLDVESQSVQQAEKSDEHEFDKIAIWPPRPIDDFAPSIRSSGRFQNVQFLQRVFQNFMKVSHDEQDFATASNDLDDEEESDTGATTAETAIRRSSNIWVEAENRFDELDGFLNDLEVVGGQAPNIWPICMLMCSVVLLARASVVRQSKGLTKTAPISQLARKFVNLIFNDRYAWEGYVLPSSGRYRGTPYPAIAEDLSETFKYRPPSECARFYLVVFAYLFAAQKRSSQFKMPLLSWLTFRASVGDILLNLYSDSASNRGLFNRFFASNNEGITWGQIEEALNSLAQFDLSNLPGVVEAEKLVKIAKDRNWEEILKLSASYASCLRTFTAKQSGAKFEFKIISNGQKACTVTGCKKAYVTNPLLSALSLLKPVICDGCGTVLISKRLASVLSALGLYV